jgi:O-antigen/teichoic acid export membrane protein
MSRFSQVVARNSAAGIGAQLAIKLLSFGFTILIVRNLGAEVYGQYVAVLAFGMIFIFIADMGLSPYAVRSIARLRDTVGGADQIGQLYGDLLLLRLLLALLASALVLGSAWLTGRPLAMIGALAISCLGLLLYSAQGASEALLAGHERLDVSAVARVLQQLAFVLIGAAALLFSTGYYGLMLANLAGIALTTLVCLRGAARLGLRPARATPARWAGMLRRSIPFGVIGFTLGLSYKFDTVLLNIFRNDQETGLYNAAYSLVFSMVMVSNMINTALYPSLTRQAESDPGSLPQIYQQSLRYLMLLALPIAVGGATLAHQIVPFLYGAEYAPAAAALRIVIWVVPLMFASEFLGYVVVVAGLEGRVAQAVLLSTAVNIGFNLLLIPRFGFMSAAVLTVITELVLVSQYLWMLRDQLRRVAWVATLGRPALAAALMGGLLLLLDRLGAPLLLSVAVGGVSYLGLVFALGIVGRNELRFVRGLRRNAEAVS